MNQRPSIIEQYAQAERDYIDYNIYMMNDARVTEINRVYDLGDAGRYVLTIRRDTGEPEQAPAEAQEPTTEAGE